MPAGESAYIPLANVTTSGAISSLSFSGISQSYRDLVIVASYPTSGAGGTSFTGVYLNGEFNNGSYGFVEMSGNGSSFSSTKGNPIAQIIFSSYGTPDGGLVSAIVQIPDYSATNKQKTVLGRIDSPGSFAAFGAGRWSSNAAVTTVSFRFSGLTMPAGATFALYGVSA